MNCPNCNFKNSTNSRFCCQCGSPIAEKKICSHCNYSDIPNEAVFCPDCGKPIKRSEKIQKRDYNISQLREMRQNELVALAESFGLGNIEKLNKDNLIYLILDQQYFSR
jgi:NMD protein affecting ribosome stability and mRNA decay